MSKWQRVILILLLVSLAFQFNCATIFDGSKKPEERTSDIQWGYVILDVLGTGLLGLIIDFADGAIYSSNKLNSNNIEQDLKDHLLKGMPCYTIKDNGCYKAELVGGNLRYSKIAQNAIPTVVWQAIAKGKPCLLAAR